MMRMPRANLTVLNDRIELERISENVADAASFLKTIGHEGRLMILCHLVSGEKSVGTLETLLSARQATVSQQLSRLRLEGLVSSRRVGKSIYYTLADDRTRKVLEAICEVFCAPVEEERKT